jgi:hypothetical protein
MVEIIRSTTIPTKDNYFKVNVLKSLHTGKITYEFFYLKYGREYHQFNHSANGLMKRFYQFWKMVVLVENHEPLVRVLYKVQYELLVKELHSPNHDLTNSVERIQPDFHLGDM